MSSITELVRDKYGAVARSGLSNDSEAVKSVAAAFGYSAEELASLPPNPTWDYHAAIQWRWPLYVLVRSLWILAAEEVLMFCWLRNL